VRVFGVVRGSVNLSWLDNPRALLPKYRRRWTCHERQEKRRHIRERGWQWPICSDQFVSNWSRTHTGRRQRRRRGTRKTTFVPLISFQMNNDDDAPSSDEMWVIYDKLLNELDDLLRALV